MIHKRILSILLVTCAWTALEIHSMENTYTKFIDETIKKAADKNGIKITELTSQSDLTNQSEKKLLLSSNSNTQTDDTLPPVHIFRFSPQKESLLTSTDKQLPFIGICGLRDDAFSAYQSLYNDWEKQYPGAGFYVMTVGDGTVGNKIQGKPDEILARVKQGFDTIDSQYLKGGDYMLGGISLGGILGQRFIESYNDKKRVKAFFAWSATLDGYFGLPLNYDVFIKNYLTSKNLTGLIPLATWAVKTLYPLAWLYFYGAGRNDGGFGIFSSMWNDPNHQTCYRGEGGCCCTEPTTQCVYNNIVNHENRQKFLLNMNSVDKIHLFASTNDPIAKPFESGFWGKTGQTKFEETDQYKHNYLGLKDKCDKKNLTVDQYASHHETIDNYAVREQTMLYIAAIQKANQEPLQK